MSELKDVDTREPVEAKRRGGNAVVFGTPPALGRAAGTPPALGPVPSSLVCMKKLALQFFRYAGTLLFMAPETVKPTPDGSQKLSHAVDIWALGVMLFQFLHEGKAPLDGYPFYVYTRTLCGHIMFTPSHKKIRDIVSHHHVISVSPPCMDQPHVPTNFMQLSSTQMREDVFQILREDVFQPPTRMREHILLYTTSSNYE